ncbi:hypothetical protein B0A55_02543 [Friedmanniomyces simplex]|uniref:Xylanolytic transcriptional activator regulatory domain-containing protein n=1 Tax=Friedmanniomyces simplex TaxID=329884 RepID=A0A4U0XTI4_9PEZI|nr:hypothetical protein B0A55_02543 [Friedmanniomyces simplex]
MPAGSDGGNGGYLAGQWPSLWAGQITGWTGLVRVDDTVYTWMGLPKPLPTAVNQTSFTYTSARSIFSMDAGPVTLNVTFLSPVTPNDLLRQSMPITYLSVEVQSADGKEHNVQLYTDVSAEWTSGDRSQIAQWDYGTENAEGLTHQSGADVDVRGQFTSNGVLNNTADTNYRAIDNNYPVFGYAIDLGSVGSASVESVFTINLAQEQAVQFDGANGVEALPSYWTSSYSDELSALYFLYNDYSHVSGMCTDLDNKIASDSNAINPDYLTLTSLALRQTFNGLTVVGNSSTPYVFLKEISSDGDISTVDVIFPSAPVLLYTNPTLLKMLLEPIFIYTEAGHFTQGSYALHDLGFFPNATSAGSEEQPLEECGNMLIMTLAYAQRSGDTGFLSQHYNTLSQWTNYLVEDSLIPANQISTDDFAGSLANQTNLALKGMIGIQAMAVIANMTGHASDGANFSSIAADYITQWQTLGVAHDANPPHTTLAYGMNDTHGLLYNLYADALLQTKLVPKEIYQMQSDFYPTVANTYGVPLDTRHAYSKNDWEMFCAAIATANTSNLFISDIANFINKTPSNGPVTDLYDTNTGDYAANTSHFLDPCAARGHPKECKFVVEEGNDYSPIQQSYEIRKLRQENQRLKERLQAARLPHSGDENEDGKGTTSGRAPGRQRRFKTGDRIDNIYFGTPGLANIVHDFANLQMGSHSLTHTMPRPRQTHGLAREMYALTESIHPFPVFANWTGQNALTALVELLPPREELFSILDSFQRRAQSFSFPHTPDEVTKKEVERFLANADANGLKYPHMLALLFATLATGLQMGEHDRNGGQWVEGSMQKTMTQANVYIAASMQALRISSYMHHPTLLGIQAMIMMGPYLTNSGRFLEAWTLFGTTIRIAHSIGLHRDPQLLDPAPSLRESMLRRTLWWWMLHMDQHYSVTLGRPLGISGFGDCPPPEPLTTNPIILRLGQFVDHFTILARQILSSDAVMLVPKIDEFTDKLVGLWDTMPESLQFNESWSQPDTPLPDWPLEVMSATLFAKVQSFLILLNRQRVERTQSAAGNSPPNAMMMPGSYSLGTYGSDHLLHHAAVRGRDLVINSSISILQTFLFFHHRNPAVLICWTMGQQAFNASMILLIDAWETGNTVNQWWVDQAYIVFVGLDSKGVHKLAGLAVQRISDGVAQLGLRQKERKEQASASRRSSSQYQQQQQQQQHHQQQPVLQLDTASMADWSADAVMGNTGMFLLEDSGLQSHVQPRFQPLGWNMAGGRDGSATLSPLSQQYPSNPPTVAPSPKTAMIPVSHVTAAPFPVVMSPPFTIPVTNLPYAVGLQPRMPTMHRRSTFQQRQQQQPQNLPSGGSYTAQPQSAFTPLNSGSAEYVSPQFQQLRGGMTRHSQSSASSPRGVHKHDRVPGGRSQARGK